MLFVRIGQWVWHQQFLWYVEYAVEIFTQNLISYLIYIKYVLELILILSRFPALWTWSPFLWWRSPMTCALWDRALVVVSERFFSQKTNPAAASCRVKKRSIWTFLVLLWICYLILNLMASLCRESQYLVIRSIDSMLNLFVLKEILEVTF